MAGNLALGKLQAEWFRQGIDLKDIRYPRWHQVNEAVANVMTEEFLQFEMCKKFVKDSTYEYGTKELLKMVVARATNNIRANQKRTILAQGNKVKKSGGTKMGRGR